MAFLSGIIFISLGLGADSAPSVFQSRAPPQSVTGLPSVPPSLDGYSYLMMKLGPLQLTRKGFLVASTSACLSFTVCIFHESCMFLIGIYHVQKFLEHLTLRLTTATANY